jgi:hypothetical protein
MANKQQLERKAALLTALMGILEQAEDIVDEIAKIPGQWSAEEISSDEDLADLVAEAYEHAAACRAGADAAAETAVQSRKAS